jgi:hypothetical protein
MKDLESGCRKHDGRQLIVHFLVGKRVKAVRVCAHGLPTPIAKEPAKSLPASKIIACEVGHGCEFRSDFGDLCVAFGKKVVNLLLNEVN